MRCKYGDIWLTGLPWNEDCGEIVWSASQLVEVTPLVRAVTPFLAGRGNVAEQLPVPIVIQNNDVLDALQYIVELPWLLPSEGTLVFVETTPTNELTITYPLAAWNGVQRQRIGSALVLTFNFTITGPPEFSYAAPSGLNLKTESGKSLLTEDNQNITTE